MAERYVPYKLRLLEEQISRVCDIAEARSTPERTTYSSDVYREFVTAGIRRWEQQQRRKSRGHSND